jgi:hypothetical protein
MGIYVGDNVMLHCGDPIQFTYISLVLLAVHFYAFETELLTEWRASRIRNTEGP